MSVRTSYGGGGQAANVVVEAIQCHGSNVGPMGTLRAGNGNECGGVPVVCVTGDTAHALRSVGGDASEDGTGRGTPIVATPINMQAAAKTGKRSPNMVGVGNPGDPSPTLNTNDRHAVFAFSSKDSGADVGEVSPTLRAMAHAESHMNDGGQVAVAFHSTGGGRDLQVGEMSPPLKVGSGIGLPSPPAVMATGMTTRRLTPTECLRLQGLPDDWLDLDPPLSDSAKYRAIGNAGIVPCVEWQLRRLREAIQTAEKENLTS